MSHMFRPAIKSEAKPLVGLYSESGCGKTLSALYLARGFAGSTGRVGMIETEAGRGEAYASVIPGGYDVLPIRGDFSPREYGTAIDAAEKAALTALIIDSASHEWEAVGGVLHMAAKNEEDGKKGMLVWQEPKMDHQRHFIQRLISTPIPLVIVCMRAKYPMVEKKGVASKEWVRSEKLDPTQSENILFEMFVHGWIDREHRFHGTKYTLDELRAVFTDAQSISLATGERLAEWAKGATAGPVPGRTESDDDELIHERSARLGLCKLIAREEGWTKGQWRDAWRVACGEATEANVDPAALADLERSIKGSAAA